MLEILCNKGCSMIQSRIPAWCLDLGLRCLLNHTLTYICIYHLIRLNYWDRDRISTHNRRRLTIQIENQKSSIVMSFYPQCLVVQMEGLHFFGSHSYLSNGCGCANTSGWRKGSLGLVSNFVFLPLSNSSSLFLSLSLFLFLSFFPSFSHSSSVSLSLHLFFRIFFGFTFLMALNTARGTVGRVFLQKKSVILSPQWIVLEN